MIGDLKIGDWVRWSLSETMSAGARNHRAHPARHPDRRSRDVDAARGAPVRHRLPQHPRSRGRYGVSGGAIAPHIRVVDLYDTHYGRIPTAEWPPHLPVGVVIDTGVAPGVIQRRPRSDDGPKRDCVTDGCDMPVTGGPCTRCGYPIAYTHPDCVSDALGMDVVYVNGTAMNVIGDHNVEYGVVRVSHSTGSLSAPYPIPPKPGDWVRWESVLRPRNWVEGELISIAGSKCDIKVQAEGDDRHRSVGPTETFGLHNDNLRRIKPPTPSGSSDFRADPDAKKPLNRVPLDVEYDGSTLRHLLLCDQLRRQIRPLGGPLTEFTAAQRSALATHWSDNLKGRIAAGPSPDAEAWRAERCRERVERERNRVLVDLDD